MPNKLSQFWQELKRRKVVRVITVYAAAAFVILELVDIIAEPLKLPTWILPVVIVLLSIGFIIAIILSWIYDIHPDEGMVKTEPAERVKVEEIPKSSNSWKIASYVSFIVIVGLIVLHIVPRTGKKEILEKSIAVLPLMNLSTNEDISSIGYTSEIIMELQKIEALDRVLSLTSTMQFAEKRPTITDIGELLNVNYIIEGTIQKQGEKVSINIKVIIAREDDHIWGEEFEDAWENRFQLQDEIAFQVAKELQIILSPSEIERIEKVATTSVTANDLYQRGRAEFDIPRFDDKYIEALERAKDFYHKALNYDPTFAQAYVGLGQIYIREHISDRIYSENALDSVRILADKALSYDDQLDGAYVLRGLYYQHGKSNYKQAINEYDKAIAINPNAWGAYWNKGIMYFSDDHVKALYNLHKAALLHRGSFLPSLYKKISDAYASAGFKDQSDYYFNESFKLEPDSAAYYDHLSLWPHSTGNYEKAIEFLEKSYAIDSSNPEKAFMLGLNHMFFGQYEESLEYLKIYDIRSKALNSLDAHYTYRIGYAYWINGFKEEAEYYLTTGLEMLNGMFEEDRHFYHDYMTYYCFAAIYAFKREKVKAYENLRLLNQRQRMPLFQVANIKDDPMFDSLRQDPEFQQIVSDVETKYQAEHERVRQWLEENDML